MMKYRFRGRREMAGRTISCRYCDEPMARSKGIIGRKRTSLPRCGKECRNCIACMEVDADGKKEHMNVERGRMNGQQGKGKKGRA